MLWVRYRCQGEWRGVIVYNRVTRSDKESLSGCCRWIWIVGIEVNRRMVWDEERKEKIKWVRCELLSCCLKIEWILDWEVSIGNM